MKANPEIHIQFGAGGDTAKAELEAEDITENPDPLSTNVATKIMKEVGMENVMFEAADPQVLEWCIKNYGVDVNLFIDHDQIVQLECLRRGIWDMKSSFGRIIMHREY